MFDRIRTLIARLHDVKEINALSDRDFADIGFSREQVLDFVNMPSDTSQRVLAMGEIFGVPEADLKRDHGQWADLLTVCGHCTDRGACSHVLAMGEVALPSDAGFCRNRNTFASLAGSAA